MTVKNIIDALCGVDFNMVLDAAPAEHGGANQTKPRKKKKNNWIKWIPLAACIVLCACLTPFVLNLLSGLPVAASEVHLTGISGGDLAELPTGVSELKFEAEPEIMLLNSRSRLPEITDEDFQQPEDVDVFGQATLSPIAQTVVLFDENKYASVTIALDNPYEYYICDFYMTCSQPDAMINVDNKWLPLDGSVKIRWTGSTNREATYTVYLPTVSGDTTVSITDMRYLNEKEIAVDLAAHNVANVYRMEMPLKTEFVINTTEGFYFRVITTANCLSYTVENAVPTEESGVYKLKSDGTYTVKYTFTIPGTELTGEGEILSEEIELLKVYIFEEAAMRRPSYVNDTVYHSEYSMYTLYGATCHIGGITLRGTGMTFHKADLDDIRERYFSDCYFSDANLTISIAGSEFGRCIYFENASNGSDRFGWMHVVIEDPIAGDIIGTSPVEIRWNGYTIYQGVIYTDPT